MRTTPSADLQTQIWHIIQGGERVTHLYPDITYYAHLSLYAFVTSYCQDKIVLDAGSGAGYGADYLVKHGARAVWGVDVSRRATRFSRRHFHHKALRFQALDLRQIHRLPQNYFDVVYTSNTLEHVPDVGRFFGGVCQILKQDGLMVMAVPSIINDSHRQANLANPYHLHIWSPCQWYQVASTFFADVTCYRHLPVDNKRLLEPNGTHGSEPITERDFTFIPASIDELNRLDSMTAIFVVRGPLPAGKRPAPSTAISFVDDSFSRPPVVQRKCVWESEAVLAVRALITLIARILRREGIGGLMRRIIGLIATMFA